MSGVEVVNFGCRLNIAEGEAIRTAARAVSTPSTTISAASALITFDVLFTFCFNDLSSLLS